ncbi:hypothetical protein COO60DRAFT_1024861 [Scenedesmus sp. NREL 46B-D3]|nr:hypothetical protein COO60DRAFT_1024861 [Scenedesmus sp. NREL 46B-D3]
MLCPQLLLCMHTHACRAASVHSHGGLKSATKVFAKMSVSSELCNTSPAQQLQNLSAKQCSISMHVCYMILAGQGKPLPPTTPSTP